MPATKLKRGPGRPTLNEDGSEPDIVLLKLQRNLRERGRSAAELLGVSEQELIRKALRSYLETIQA